MRKTLFTNIQTESYAAHSGVGQVGKWLVKYSMTKDCSVSSICFSRDLSRVVHLLVSREQFMNFTVFTIFHQTLTLNPYIKSHQHTRKWLTKNTIKFYMELKPTKHSWKSQLYNPKLDFKSILVLCQFSCPNNLKLLPNPPPSIKNVNSLKILKLIINPSTKYG